MFLMKNNNNVLHPDQSQSQEWKKVIEKKHEPEESFHGVSTKNILVLEMGG